MKNNIVKFLFRSYNVSLPYFNIIILILHFKNYSLLYFIYILSRKFNIIYIFDCL